MKWLKSVLTIVIMFVISSNAAFAQFNCADLEMKLEEVREDVAVTFLKTNKLNKDISGLNKSLDKLIDEVHRTRVSYNLALKDPKATTTEIAKSWGDMMRAEKALDEAVGKIAELNELLLRAKDHLEAKVKERTALEELYERYCKPKVNPNPPVPIPESP